MISLEIPDKLKVDYLNNDPNWLNPSVQINLRVISVSSSH